MEALSRIGEFFFDDGLISEEERLMAYERYKEKVRNNNNANNNNNKNSSTKIKITVPVKSQSKDVSLEKKDADPPSSRKGQSTATKTTHTSAIVSTTDGSVSSSRSGDSKSSSTSDDDDLESMIPETVCADLSIRSVSTRSVISESASTDSSSKSDEGSKKGSQVSKKEESTRSGSGTRGTRTTGTGSGTRGSGTTRTSTEMRSRSQTTTTATRDDSSTHSDGSDDRTSTTKSPKQRPPEKRILIPIGKGRNRTRSFYSRLWGGGFRLSARSASTNTRQDTEAGTGTDTSTEVGCEDRFERRMVDQLMEYISSGDDDSEDSGSTTSSQDSNSQTSSSLLHSQGTSKYDRTRSRGTATSGVTAGTSEASITKESTAFNSKRQSSTKSVPVAVTAATSNGFETGIDQTASHVSKSEASMNTKSTRSKAIHGWIEKNDDKDAASGDRIELAITSSSSSDSNDEIEQVDVGEPEADSPEETHHGLSHKATEAAQPSEETKGKPSVETLEALQKPATILEPTKKVAQPKLGLPLQLPKATAKSNASPALPPRDPGLMGPKTKSRAALLTQGTDKRLGKDPPTPQDEKGEDETKAFLQAIAQTTNDKPTRQTNYESTASRTRSLAVQNSSGLKSKPSTLPSKEAGQFFTTNLILENPNSKTASYESYNHSLLQTMKDNAKSKVNQHALADLSSETIQSSQDAVETQNFSAKPPLGSQQTQRRRSQSSMLRTQNTSTSIVTHQVQPVKHGFIVSTCSNGSTSMLIHEGTMESETSNDLHEFIEVTYDSSEGQIKSPAASPVASPPASPSVSVIALDQGASPQADRKPAEANHVGEGDSEQLTLEENQEGSPRKRKGFFGTRFLHRKKKDKANVPVVKSGTFDHKTGAVARRKEPNTSRNDGEGEEQTVIDDEAHSRQNERGQLKDVTALGVESRGSRVGQEPQQIDSARNAFMMALQVQGRNNNSRDTVPQGEAKDSISRGKASRQQDQQQQDVQDDDEDNQPGLDGHRKGPLALFGAKKSRSAMAPSAGANRHRSFAAAPLDVVGETAVPTAHSESPRRNKWVRSFSLPKKRRNQSKTKRDKEDTIALNLETRLPSTLPLPRGGKVEADGAGTDIRVQTPTTLADGTFAGATYEMNPWHAGHPSYFAYQENKERLCGSIDDTCANSDYDQPLAKKLLESEVFQMEQTPQKRPTVQFLHDAQRLVEYSQAPEGEAEATGRTNPKLSKKSLKKIKSGVNRILRWHAKLAKPEHTDTSGSDVDIIPDVSDRRNLPLDEEQQEAGPLTLPGGVEDDTFLMQHQRMMQSRNPAWKQPARIDATPKAGARKDRHDGAAEGQTKLQRVLGQREKARKARYTDSTTNSILDARIPEQKLEQHLQKILRSLSSTSSASGSSGGNGSNDGTHDFTQDDTIDDTLEGGYSVRNQRVLDTLRLLHAVKRKKKKEIIEREGAARKVPKGCNEGIMDPLIDEIEAATCGIRFS